MDQVVPILGQLLPLVIAHAFDADVVDRLPRLEKLDHLVQAFWFVAGVPSLTVDWQRESGQSQDQQHRHIFHLYRLLKKMRVSAADDRSWSYQKLYLTPTCRIRGNMMLDGTR